MKLKSIHGWFRDGYDHSSGNGDNSSGFNATPGGYRDEDLGFTEHGYTAKFWSSDAWIRGLGGDGVYRSEGYYRNGYSVRCLQN